MHTNYQLNPAQLSQLEKLINKYNLIDPEFGATLNERLIVDFYNNNYQGGLRFFARKIIKYLILIFSLLVRGGSNYKLSYHEVLITKQFDREDLNLLIYKTLTLFKNQKIIVLTNERDACMQKHEDVIFITMKDVGVINFHEILLSLQNAFILVKTLNGTQTNINLTLQHKTIIILEVIFQSFQYFKQRSFISQTGTKLLITEYDRGRLAAPLVLNAKSLNIPVITFVHGALEKFPSYGFTPILADQACCWGELHVQQFIQHGESIDKLEIVGNHSLPDQKKDTSIIPKFENVLVATNPVSPVLKRDFIELVRAAIGDCHNLKFHLRIHPAEEASFYIRDLETYSNFELTTLSKEDALSTNDIIIVGDSSFAYDAVLAHKLVIAVCLPGQELSTITELIESGCIKLVYSQSDLKTAITHFIERPEVRQSLLTAVETFANRYVLYRGEDAVSRLKTLIEERVRTH